MQSPTIVNPAVLAPVNPAIEKYMRSLVSQTDHPVLAEMEAVAEKNNFPIVGRLVGIFLETLAKTVNAKRIFEFGSGYGYSAYWFARAVGANGRVICTMGILSTRKRLSNISNLRIYRSESISESESRRRYLRRPKEIFDICYNDADKGDYPQIWRMAKERIRPGGLYIADNVLWHGRVAVEHYVDIVPGWTEAILEHNHSFLTIPNLTLLSIRLAMALSWRVKKQQ